MRKWERDLREDLYKSFIQYQHQLDHPMSVNFEAEAMDRFRNDGMFHARVTHIVEHIMGTIYKHVPTGDASDE